MLGIMNGMVMQRNGNDVCEITVVSEKELSSVKYSGKVSGIANIKPIGNGEYQITGIPVGGPYSIDIDGETFTDIYVGDLWILAGQSNMQGVGWLTDEEWNDKGHPEIRALYMQDYWGPAVDPLHLMWRAKDKIHITLTEGWDLPDDDRDLVGGVGPGVSFARKMYELENKVPQGLLCCAHGGTSLTQWSPDLKSQGADYSLYAAMLRRFKANGSNVKGMFWYQGCHEGFACEGDIYTQLMKKFMDAVHEDFGNIPTIQVQIARVAHEELEGVVESWMKVRESQRLMDRVVDNLYTISAINKPTDDIIHLSRGAQNELGAQAAEAMYYAVYGTNEKGFIAPPQFDSIKLHEHPVNKKITIEVKFKNLYGSLKSLGRPTGFSITHNKYDRDIDVVICVELDGDTAFVRTELTKERMQGAYLYYGFGLNPYCNITDQRDRELPCFGPIEIL